MGLKGLLMVGSIFLDMALLLWLMSIIGYLNMLHFTIMFLIMSILTGIFLRVTGQFTLDKISKKYKKSPGIKGKSIIGVFVIMLTCLLLLAYFKMNAYLMGSFCGIVVSLFYIYIGYDLIYNILMMYNQIEKMLSKG